MTTPRRRRDWHDSFIDEAGTAGGNDETVLLDAAPDGANKGRTLVRMIIDLHIQASAPVATGTDLMQVNLGIGMVSEDVLEGSISVGTEGDTPISGWLWRRRVIVAENLSANLALLSVEGDIRSQRKLMYGEPRLFIQYTAQTGTAFAVSTTGLIRALYLLP